MSCCLWFGGRFIYFYLQNHKSEEVKDNSVTLSSLIIKNENNNSNFKLIKDSYYFTNDSSSNYVSYSNISFRIFKIKNNKIYLISENNLTGLAYGDMVDDYSKSYIYKWLNKDSDDENSGIFENSLNNTDKYLEKYDVCIDKVDDATKVTCNDVYSNANVGLLSITDYANTGGKNSFINNSQYTYLSNRTTENEVWFINDEGKLNTSNGSDIYGVKPVIVLNKDVKSVSGNGTKESPYVIDEENGYFGSYVNLDNDIWRIYEEDDDNVKLMLNDYLKVNDENLSYIYSNNNYFHNDTAYGSLAYYLNRTYLNSLSYKDIILESKYSNGVYDISYDYSNILEKTVDTKVSVMSIGNIILNNYDNIWTNTGSSSKNSNVYVLRGNMNISSKGVNNEAFVVPCITISKSNLTKGNGSYDDPYMMVK